MVSTVGAIAEAVSIAMKIINDHINDPKRRARAIADYVRGLQSLKERLNEAEMEEVDHILLTLINSRP